MIGYLGTTTPSFLDQSVLINDLKLMKTTDKAFFAVDGSQITEKHHLQYAKADHYQNNVGLDRKINSDFFSPLLVYFSTVIIFLCNVLIAYTLSQDLSQQNKVTYLLGDTTIKRLLNNSSYLLTIYLVAASIALGLSQWLIISQGTLFGNLKVIVWQLLVIMVVFLVFFVRGEKELHHGMVL